MKRELKFDIFKLLLMYLIIIWHANVHGLLLDENWNLHLSMKFDNFINIFDSFLLNYVLYISSVSVNCFVLITGYFSVNKHRKLDRLINLWLTTFFYSIVIFIIFKLRGTANGILDYGNLFPIITSRYWFISQYLALMFLSPFLNIFISCLTRKTFNKLIFFLSIFLLSFFRYKSFSLPLGNLFYGNFIWFIYLYIIGAYIRLYNPFIGYNYFGKLFFIVAGLSAVYRIIISYLNSVISGEIPIFVVPGNNGFTFILALLLFMWVKNSEFSENKYAVLFSKCAPYVFGIYLIHDNKYIRSFLWHDLVQLGNIDSFPLLLLNILIISALVFFVCLVIDYVRSYIFICIKCDAFVSKIIINIRKIEKLMNF